jgi:SAM-dependent methyltransferase
VGWIVRILLALVGLVVSAQVAGRLARRFAPDLVPSLPFPGASLRAALFQPDRLLQQVPLEPGMRVLLIGPASPALAAAIARAVGKYGKLYAVEPSAERCRRLEARLSAERILNGEVMIGDLKRLELPDSTFDLVLCVAVLASTPNRQRALWELARVLRPGGHLSVSEAVGGLDYLSRGTLRREAGDVGLAWREQHGLPTAYTANFRKPA